MIKVQPRKPTALFTTKAFFTKGGCSETLFFVLNRAFGQSYPIEERAASPLSGGMLQQGYQCGQIWGAALAAGAEAHRRFRPGPEAQTMAIAAAQRIVTAFRARNGAIDCYDFTTIDATASGWKLTQTFLFQGRVITCARMASRSAPVLHNEIQEAFAAEPSTPLAGPVSCAALLAERLGASEAQITMAAGLAGGIGLSGGACGALGAAVWLTTLRDLESGDKLEYRSPKSLAVVERFLKAADYEFECARIVGRTFESASDHACHLCQGGCTKLLDALAEPSC